LKNNQHYLDVKEGKRAVEVVTIQG